MSKYTFGFLGCGNMGGALASAASLAIAANRLAVCDADSTKTDAFVKANKAVAVSVEELAKESAYLFLAVKPQGLQKLFEQIKETLRCRTDRFVIVSMAAGVSIETIESYACGAYPIIRMMPNTPVAVGEGMTVYATNAKATEEDVNGFLNGLAQAGRFDRVSETLIDAAGALSGCGPAFVYLFAEALADGGVSCGLPRDKANEYAAQTLLGAAKMLLETGKHPGELKDAVCSPGGTTIEGVHALESSAFRAASIDAVCAAYDKTMRLKKL